jgi:hypothetical protein
MDLGVTPDRIALGGLAALNVAQVVWNRILTARATTANTGAEVARAESDRAVSMAGESVFNLVSSRLQSVESELTAVRAELSGVRDQLRDRDNRIHFLELHIVDLEHCLRQHGIEPPPLRDR